MSEDNVILVAARSVAEAFPERWWIPTPELLDAIQPGRTQVRLLAIEPESDGGPDFWDARAVWLEVDARDGERLSGTIVQSSFDHDGYRVGDSVLTTQDRVLDVVFVGADGRPLLNESRARFAVGKRALVGLTLLSPDGDLVEQQQFVGRIASVDQKRGIELALDDGSSYWLPPDSRSLEEARPGEYRLRSNGQTVVDPDYTCTWTVTRPDRRYSEPGDGYHAA